MHARSLVSARRLTILEKGARKENTHTHTQEIKHISNQNIHGQTTRKITRHIATAINILFNFEVSNQFNFPSKSLLLNINFFIISF